MRLRGSSFDLEPIDAAAMILIGPGAEIALRDAVFATGFWNGDLAFEHLGNDRRFPLPGPAFELVGFGLWLGQSASPGRKRETAYNSSGSRTRFRSTPSRKLSTLIPYP